MITAGTLKLVAQANKSLLAAAYKGHAPQSRLATRHKQTDAKAQAQDGLSHTVRQQLQHYLDCVLQRNKVMNLTAVCDRDEAWVRHIEDSLTVLPLVQQLTQHQDQPRVTDVGSGAGFPGMVLAIAQPELQVVLLDSVRKRCTFLQSASTDMGLSNVEVVWARAEQAGQDERLREVVLARAVAELRVLAEYCLPLVKLHGSWIALKGPQPEAELAAATEAIQQLGGGAAKLLPMPSFGEHGQRTAVIVSKERLTPKQYPRREGTPKKFPL